MFFSGPLHNIRHSFLSGINIFLDGFVPTENLRFREQVLTFKVSETAEKEAEVKREARYKYPDMIKDFGR